MKVTQAYRTQYLTKNELQREFEEKYCLNNESIRYFFRQIRIDKQKKGTKRSEVIKFRSTD